MGEETSISSALLYQYAGAAAFVFSGGVFWIILAKFFTTAQVGTVSLLLAITGILMTIFSLSLPVAASHFISFNLGKRNYGEAKHLISRLILISFLLSLVAAIFIFFASGELSALFFHSSSDVTLIRMASLYVAATIIFGILHGAMLGLQLFRNDGIIYLSSASVSYFVGLLFLFLFHGILYLVVGLTMSYVWGSIIYILVIFLKMPRNKGRKEVTSLGQVVSYALPLVLSSTIGYGSQNVDKFVVSYFLNVSTLGIYSFVLTVSFSLTFLSGPITNILLPKLSEYFSVDDNEKIKKGLDLSIGFTIFMYFPLAVGMASVAPIVLSVLARSVYVSGYIPFEILLAASCIYVLGGLISTLLSAIRKTKIYLISALSTAASNIVLSFILIPKIGLVGAAVANSSVYIVSFIVIYYFSILKGIRHFDWVTVVKISLSSLFMFIAVSLERNFLGNHVLLLPLYILTGGVVYFVFLNLMHSLGRIGKDQFLSQVPAAFGLKKIAKILLVSAF